eukprot:359403-Amphidinium_carterae.1
MAATRRRLTTTTTTTQSHVGLSAVPVRTAHPNGNMCLIGSPSVEKTALANTTDNITACYTTHAIGGDHVTFTTVCDPVLSYFSCALLSMHHSTVSEPSATSAPPHCDSQCSPGSHSLMSVIGVVQLLFMVANIGFYIFNRRRYRHRYPSRSATLAFRVPLWRQGPRDLRHLLPPRDLLQGGAPRHNSPPVQRATTLFSSPSSMNPHCLFASALFVARLEVSMNFIQQLRTSLADVLKFAHAHSVEVAGHSVAYWAHLAGMSVQEYLRSTNLPGYRMGNSCDAFVISELLGTSIWVVDSNLRPSMFSHVAKPWALIQHEDGHFFVRTLPDELTLPEVYFTEIPTTLPTQLLDRPRTNAMTHVLLTNNRQARFDHVLYVKSSHKHLTDLSTHARLQIIVPSFHYILVQKEVHKPVMTFTVNGLTVDRPYEEWTAAVRLAVELDVTDINAEHMFEIYERVDIFVKHQIQEVYESLLLPPQLEEKYAHEACLHVLAKTMAKFPQRFIHFFPTYRFSVLGFGSNAAHLATYEEYLRMRRLNQLDAHVYYILETEDMGPNRTPTVILEDSQVPCVRSALWQIYQVELRPVSQVTESQAPGPTSPAVSDHEPIEISLTQPMP